MSDTTTQPRILILDDDEVMRNLLDALLSLDGFLVAVAPSGPDGALLLSSGLSVDLILTDLQMAGPTGVELAALLRGAMAPDTLLLGMSASEPENATRAAFDGFLLKPLDAQAVRAAAEKARIARPQSGPEATGSQGQSEPAHNAGVPVLDETIYDSLCKIIPADKLAGLYEMTVADILTRYERMQAAAASGDLVTVKQEAHATKGSCGMVGAQELQRIAAAIEEGTSLNTEKIGEIPEACARLRRMLTGKLK